MWKFLIGAFLGALEFAAYAAAGMVAVEGGKKIGQKVGLLKKPAAKE